MLKVNWSIFFSFSLFVSEISHFCVYPFVVQIFFIFQDIVLQLSHIDVFIVVPFINSTRLAIVAEADLSCGDSCLNKVVVTNW